MEFPRDFHRAAALDGGRVLVFLDTIDRHLIRGVFTAGLGNHDVFNRPIRFYLIGENCGTEVTSFENVRMLCAADMAHTLWRSCIIR